MIESSSLLIAVGKQRKQDQRPMPVPFKDIYLQWPMTSYQALPLKSSTTSQYHHSLVIKCLTHRPLGDIADTNYSNMFIAHHY
jgi:hypothetical protein